MSILMAVPCPRLSGRAMYTDVTVVENRAESETVSSLFFDRRFKARAGQFLMLWLPGVGEKPYSLSYANGITVKKVGPFSNALASVKSGTRLAARGPLGKGFSQMPGRVLLIGGGCGMAPLRLLAQQVEEPLILLGGKTADDILFLKEFQGRGEVKITTEDGSTGKKGLITELLPERADYAALCGPEPMMAASLKLLSQERTKVFVALERYMKCAMGLCGACTCSGYRVCVDGPVFSAATLIDMRDFGWRRRAKSGRFEPVSGGVSCF